MGRLAEQLQGVHPLRQRLSLVLAFAATAPALVMRVTGSHIAHPVDAIVFGVAIVGSAFLLSWGAEVAQLDISAGLAIALLALIAVLPEYAVGMVFAWEGGNTVQAFGPACHAPGEAGATACSLVLANMTGANRLLIGVGWPLVVFIAWWRSRSRREWVGEVRLARQHTVEIAYLGLATAYSLLLPLKHSVTLVDAAVLVAIFAAYTIRLSRAPAEEPELVGPARYLATLSVRGRRLAVAGLFAFAALVILLCAEHFADALVASGRQFGVSEFLLVQWLAPIASEAPELLVAGLFAWRLNTNAGLATLVSSKVNQWTLLVGTLPVVFAIAVGGLHGLPLDHREREELFLTAAQSFFGLAVLATLSISLREALLLFSLFWAQFVIGGVSPAAYHGIELIVVGAAYLALGTAVFVRDREQLPGLIRDGFRTSYRTLSS